MNDKGEIEAQHFTIKDEFIDSLNSFTLKLSKVIWSDWLAYSCDQVRWS